MKLKISVFKQDAPEAYLVDTVSRKVTIRGNFKIVKYKKKYYRFEFTKRNDIGFYIIIPDFRVS